jgi:long-subunit fatty acid transport protein
VAQTYAGLTYRGGTGYSGELHNVSLYGAYPLLDRTLVPNASFSFGSYRLSEDAPQDNALAVAVGATYRPLPVLSIDLQVQDVSNKVLDSDVRFFGKINFWFAERMSILE